MRDKESNVDYLSGKSRNRSNSGSYGTFTLTDTSGKRHTSIENLKRGLPSHLKGEAIKVARDLIREGLLVAKKTAHGIDVSINPRRAREVKEFLERFET